MKIGQLFNLKKCEKCKRSFHEIMRKVTKGQKPKCKEGGEHIFKQI